MSKNKAEPVTISTTNGNKKEYDYSNQSINN